MGSFGHFNGYLFFEFDKDRVEDGVGAFHLHCMGKNVHPTDVIG